ncbi:hypothetical protein B0H12DRAFT_1113693 [Mycena haematopus]|nr:hypothetical protein B0H12DRAFT_1113693 [Mycena haematopus]
MDLMATVTVTQPHPSLPCQPDVAPEPSARKYCGIAIRNLRNETNCAGLLARMTTLKLTRDKFLLAPLCSKIHFINSLNLHTAYNCSLRSPCLDVRFGVLLESHTVTCSLLISSSQSLGHTALFDGESRFAPHPTGCAGASFRFSTLPTTVQPSLCAWQL